MHIFRENRFYRDENLTGENIISLFEENGWEETRDWAGRDDDLTFVKSPSRISFNREPNSGYSFIFYRDFDNDEYSSDYMMYSGRTLKELKNDIADFENLDDSDFLKHKVPNYFGIYALPKEDTLLREGRVKEVDTVRDDELEKFVKNYLLTIQELTPRKPGTDPTPRSFTETYHPPLGTLFEISLNGKQKDEIWILIQEMEKDGSTDYTISSSLGVEGVMHWQGMDLWGMSADLDDCFYNIDKGYLEDL